MTSDPPLPKPLAAGADALPPSAGMPPDLEADASLAEGDAPPVKVPLAVEDWVAVLAMAALALVTFVNVVVRYLSDESIAWTEEISVFLMIVVTLVGASAAVARDRHIKIEYFLDAGSAVRRRRLAAFGALATALFFALLCVLSVRLVWDDIRYEETTPGIGLPKWWYSVWLPLLSAGIAARAVGLFLRKRAQGRAGDGGAAAPLPLPTAGAASPPAAGAAGRTGAKR